MAVVPALGQSIGVRLPAGAVCPANDDGLGRVVGVYESITVRIRNVAPRLRGEFEGARGIRRGAGGRGALGRARGSYMSVWVPLPWAMAAL